MKHPLLEEHYDNHGWVTVHRYLGDQSHQTALSPWLYDLSRQFLDYNRTPTEKAWETAGDAILNYESHIITTLKFVVTCRYSNWDWVDPYSTRFVSNKTLYHNPISRQLAVQVRVKSNKPSCVIHQNENEFRCISKFFGDLFEKLVFAIFDDQRRSRNDYWYDVDPTRISQLVESLGVYDRSRFRRHIQLFVLRVSRANRDCKPMSQRLLREREKHLVDYGFHRNRSTVFLDAVLLRHTPALLNVMCYIGKQHMRLPIILDGYYRDLSPKQLHTSREMCEV